MIHCCSLIFFSKYQALSCIGYQSWHSSMGCSAHCNWVLHAFLRYQYFCITAFSIMDFLSSPGTFLLLSLGLKLWVFISNFRKVMFQYSVLPFTRHSVNLPNLKYWLFSLKAFNRLGEPCFLFVLLLLFRMLWQCCGWPPLHKVNWKLFRYCSRTAYCQWPLLEITDWSIMYPSFAIYITGVARVVGKVTVQFFPGYYLWPLYFHHCVLSNHSEFLRSFSIICAL